MLYEALREIVGLSDKQATVYLASLQSGVQPVSMIAKKAGLNRTTTYMIFDELKRKGLASQFTKRGVKYFSVIDPENLLKVVEKKQNEVEKQYEKMKVLVPQFENLINPSGVKPKVRFYEGIEGIIEVYENTISGIVEDIYSFWGPDFLPPRVKIYLEDDYVPRRVRKKIPFYVIAPDTLYSQKMLKTAKKLLRTVKLIPAEKYLFDIEINIYGDKVAFLSYKADELLGVIVESSAIANTMKMIHKITWDYIPSN